MKATGIVYIFSVVACILGAIWFCYKRNADWQWFLIVAFLLIVIVGYATNDNNKDDDEDTDDIIIDDN